MKSIFCETCQRYFNTETQLDGHRKAGRCRTKKCQRCKEMVYPRSYAKHLENCQVDSTTKCWLLCDHQVEPGTGQINPKI